MPLTDCLQQIIANNRLKKTQKRQEKGRQRGLSMSCYRSGDNKPKWDARTTSST